LSRTNSFSTSLSSLIFLFLSELTEKEA
jgi:hypothetical protein